MEPRFVATVRPLRSARERMDEASGTMIAVLAPLARVGEMIRAGTPAANAKVTDASPANRTRSPRH